MSEEQPRPTVKHNPEESRFEIELEGFLAVAEYTLGEDVITFEHTVVPPELGGRGLGSQLAKAGLAHARERQLQVIPHCEFIAAYMKKHPDMHDLVHPAHRDVLS